MAQSQKAFFASLVLWVLLSYCAAGSVVPTSKLLPRQAEIPTSNSFRRRAIGSIAVLGNYLYLDGGEIAQYVDGLDDTVLSRPINVTESIALDQTWTNASVTINSIVKAAPNAKDFTMWVDTTGNMLYAWGGEGPYDDTTGAQVKKLWAFTPDNHGGGSWAVRPPNNPATFTTIIRGTIGTVASCDDIGYWLGGTANAHSDASISDGSLPLPGLLTYDMRMGNWANLSAPFPQSTTQNGKAACYPLGSHGLVIFFGGFYSSSTDSSQVSALPLNNITFFDPSTNEWLSQTTSGETPTQRMLFCSIGVPGPNGTYEIYIYGGYNNVATPNVLSDIWILSLPAFRWFRAPLTGTPRSAHSCALVGKRQMIVVGGLNTWTDPWTTNDPPADPWTQGIGILDLPSLSWSSQYDSNASAYDLPDVVKDFYSKGGLASVIWTSDKVKSLFVNASTPTTSAMPLPTHKDTSTGAIVGGVVGGIAFLFMVGSVIYFMRRRHVRSIIPQAHQAQLYQPVETTGELDSNLRYEAPHNPMKELSCNVSRRELHHQPF